MKITGEAVLHAPVQRVWDALQDPAVLVRTIPGCERLEATGPDAYAMTVSAGVASIKGSYSGRVALSEQDAPRSFLMTAAGAGGPGTVSTEVRVSLAEADGATNLRYDADAVVGGMVAGVGQRMLVAVAKKTAGEFFAAVDDVLTGKAPASVPAPGGAANTPTGVYVAPAAGRGNDGFVRGILVGAAVALAGVAVGLLGRRR